MSEIEINFPKHIKMPEGYKVIWTSSVEMYLVIGPNNYEDGPYCCRWLARRAAIREFTRRLKDDQAS